MASIIVKSSRNPLIKEYKKLLQSRSYRRKVNKLALEGPNLVREALEAGLVPQVVFYTKSYYNSEGFKWLSELQGETKEVILTETVFNSIAETEAPRAVAAIVPFTVAKEEKLPAEFPRLVLILDRLQDPGNMGTIIRTAAAAGVDLICYTAGSVDPYSPKVLRSSTGTIFKVALKMVSEPEMLISELKKCGIKIVSGSLRAEQQLWSADLRGPLALIIGNEAGGISPAIEAAADIKLSIPISPSVDSLNAAVAAAVMLFEIVRQRSRC